MNELTGRAAGCKRPLLILISAVALTSIHNTHYELRVSMERNHNENVWFEDVAEYVHGQASNLFAMEWYDKIHKKHKNTFAALKSDFVLMITV